MRAQSKALPLRYELASAAEKGAALAISLALEPAVQDGNLCQEHLAFLGWECGQVPSSLLLPMSAPLGEEKENKSTKISGVWMTLCDHQWAFPPSTSTHQWQHTRLSHWTPSMDWQIPPFYPSLVYLHTYLPHATFSNNGRIWSLLSVLLTSSG